MKLSMSIKNFRGVASAEITPHPRITLICANNKAGKTSILQAMCSGLLGVKVPVKDVTEAQAGRLVTRGADHGYVQFNAIEEDSVSSRVVKWPSCKVETIGDDSNLPFVSEFAAGYINLLDMDSEKRAKAISRITGTEPSEADLREYLGKKVGIDPKRIDAEVANIFGVLDKNGAMVRRPGGWDNAHKNAVVQGQQLKGAFERIIGTRWGSAKGGMYMPSGWEQDLVSNSADTLEEEVVHAKAIVEAAIANEAISTHFKDELAVIAGEKDALMASLDKLRKEIEPKEVAIKEWQANKPKTVGPSELQAEVLHCAHCNAENVMKAGKLVKPEAGKITKAEQQKASADLAEWQAGMQVLQAARDGVLADIRSFNDRATKAANAEKELAALEATEAKAQKSNMIGVNEARESLRRAETRRTAFTKKSEADNIHESIMQNQRIIDALAADGLRQKKLGEGLVQFNDRLAELCGYASWDLVKLEPDLTVTMGDWPYALISESEQYRCRIAIRVALAEMENSAFILIDAADILDVTEGGKKGLISLLLKVGIQAAVAFTCPKQFVPDLSTRDFGKAYWMENRVATELVKELA